MALLMIAFLSEGAALAKTISGTVFDQDGEPAIGATVMVKGTTTGTSTDISGNFTIANVADNAILEVRYVGCQPATVETAGKTNVTVILKADNALLDEVVVVGYGVQKKSDVTGALTRVDAEALNTRPVNNAFEALQGKAAGVDITTSERPGTVGEVRIRGQRSLTADKAPLYVVDGVPLNSESGIETINPRDIEAIDILKDASATAIYGSRGANGVILVTTKQGKSGQFSLNYSGSVTTSKIVDRSPSMSAAEFVKFRRWAAYNSDPNKYAHPDQPTKENDALLFDSPLDGQTSFNNVMRGWTTGTWNPGALINTDWTDYVTRTGVTQEHTLSASGGNDQMNAYASFGYLKNEGTQKGQWYERYTGKVTTTITPVKWFTIQASINASWAERDYGMSTYGGRSGSVPDAIYDTAKGIFNHAVPYDEEGNRIINPGGESLIYTIIDEQKYTQQKSQTFRALGSFTATLKLGEIWKPLEGLQYKIAFGPDFRHWREGSFVSGLSSHKINSNGTAGSNQTRLQTRRDFSWTLDNMIIYNRTFNKKHNVGVTLLQSASKWNYETTEQSAKNIYSDKFLWNFMGSVAVSDSKFAAGMGSGLTESSMESYMIRVNYGFDERYLLTLSGRWDGASQLSKGNKWDFFPSAALAWRITQEDFMSSIDWLNNLKLRLGVGTTGNAAVAPYSTIGRLQGIYLPFGTNPSDFGITTNEPYYTANQLQMASPNLGWEKTTQWNIGIDYGFLNNRINGSIELYTSKTKDLIMDMSIPTLLGYSSTKANIGQTSNKGIEITINAIPVQTRDFSWETNFNMSYQKDKIDKLAYGKNDMVDNSWFIGEQLAVWYDFDNLGLWQDTEEDRAEMAKWPASYKFAPGKVRPRDVDNNYILNNEDKVVLGNKNPNITMGWSNNFNYKGIDLGFQFIARLNYTVALGDEALTAHANQRKVDYWRV